MKTTANRQAVKKRSAYFLAGAAACLTTWLFTLRIGSYHVVRPLERFVLYDDGRYLLTAAVCVVILNTVRAVPLYLGWFLAGEGISYLRKKGSGACWLVPLIAIPASYSLVSRYTGYLSLHFGLPALLSTLSILIMHFSTREIRGWLSRSLVLSMLVFSFQWLDIAPSLTPWGFGGGELSMTIKMLAVIEEWDWVMDALSIVVFAIAFSGGIVASVLLVGTNMLNIQYRKLRERDQKIAELREEAIGVRGYREIQQLVHDLRRPLTTMLGLADVMAETLPSGAEQDHAKRIVKTGAHMNYMIEELLKEDARQSITVSALVEYIQSQVSAFEWRHFVEADVDSSVSRQEVCVNLIRFSRALVNILDNAHLAVRSVEAPRILFRARAVDGNVLFIVEDNGFGFSDEYFGLNGFSAWGSTGIGLAFVEDVARNHGGAVSINNLAHGGAAVAVRLPLKGV